MKNSFISRLRWFITTMVSCVVIILAVAPSAHAQFCDRWTYVNCGRCNFQGYRACTAICNGGACGAPVGDSCTVPWPAADYASCSNGNGGATNQRARRRTIPLIQSIPEPEPENQGLLPVPTGIPCQDVENPLLWPSCAFQELPKLIGYLINILILGGGLAALFYILLGGYYYMSSRDNVQQLEKAKNTIVWATIGLVSASSIFVVFRLIAQSFNIPVFP